MLLKMKILNAKELIQEEPTEFENSRPKIRLIQVGQLSSCAKDKLANYLGELNKLSIVDN